jgi:hypothetical protein
MGGFDWQALPVVVELLGISDVERLIYQLKLIKETMQAKQD